MSGNLNHFKRHRRLRYHPVLRELTSETTVQLSDLVLPLFVQRGNNNIMPIASMPGVNRYTNDKLVKKCIELQQKGIHSILLFGIPDDNEKDETGSIGCHHNGVVQEAIKLIKIDCPEMFIIADVCNCEYTSHGHCGPIKDNDVDNDETLEILAKQSVSLAKAGADMIAPSDMMDGRVTVIRNALDVNGYYKTPIMSYSAKFASAFYSPFRDAANSSPKLGDRKTYQMDYRNSNEALREIETDIIEGADIVMVKPALTYLDIVSKIKTNYNIPLAVYNVSGEYSMIKFAAQQQIIDEEKVVSEILISFKRAGADIIITYFAEMYADLLNSRTTIPQ